MRPISRHIEALAAAFSVPALFLLTANLQDKAMYQIIALIPPGDFGYAVLLFILAAIVRYLC